MSVSTGGEFGNLDVVGGRLLERLESFVSEPNAADHLVATLGDPIECAHIPTRDRRFDHLIGTDGRAVKRGYGGTAEAIPAALNLARLCR